MSRVGDVLSSIHAHGGSFRASNAIRNSDRLSSAVHSTSVQLSSGAQGRVSSPLQSHKNNKGGGATSRTPSRTRTSRSGSSRPPAVGGGSTGRGRGGSRSSRSTSSISRAAAAPVRPSKSPFLEHEEMQFQLAQEKRREDSWVAKQRTYCGETRRASKSVEELKREERRSAACDGLAHGRYGNIHSNYNRSRSLTPPGTPPGTQTPPRTQTILRPSTTN